MLYYLNDNCISFSSLEEKIMVKQIDYNLYLDFVMASYMWSSGKSLREVFEYTDIYEGNFVRGILRINTICDTLIKIATQIKKYKIVKTLENVNEILIRDIVTINSLYL